MQSQFEHNKLRNLLADWANGLNDDNFVGARRVWKSSDFNEGLSLSAAFAFTGFRDVHLIRRLSEAFVVPDHAKQPLMQAIVQGTVREMIGVLGPHNRITPEDEMVCQIHRSQITRPGSGMSTLIRAILG